MRISPGEHTIQSLWLAILEAVRLIVILDPAVAEITIKSLQVTLAALVISTLAGVPLGTWLGQRRLPGQALINGLVYTGMGLPPVVVGLVVYLLLSRSGPIGWLGWLYSVPAMVTAQVILALPIITGLTMSALEALDPELKLQLKSLGATERQIGLTLLAEARDGVLVGIAAGFGSIISEVGAVMLVGGNIEGKTRVLTSAIVLETRQGHFELALALGIILLGLALASNLIIVMLQRRAR